MLNNIFSLIKNNTNSSNQSDKNKVEQKERIVKNKRLWKIICYFSIFLFLISIIFTVIYLSIFYRELIFSYNLNLEKENNVKCQDCVRRLIDGVYVKEGEENLFPIAVIIDNHIEARPSFGLSEANLVYETEVEGNITRYLAVFAVGTNIEKIGPIRSVRPYFIDWAKELSALLVHCGGSPEALVKISKENIFSLNEFYNENYFWRDNGKSAPHNIFTSSVNLKKYSNDKDLISGKFLSWSYKEGDMAIASTTHPQININFKDSNFTVKWKYDIINNEYIRYLADQQHLDGTGKEIKAKNIIVQFMETAVIDEELRLKIKTQGRGSAIICLDGKCNLGKWEKVTISSRSRYYYNNGEDVIFNAGPTWIEIVRPDYNINY